MLMATFFRLLLGYMWDCFRSHERLKAEILILRHQLNILHRKAMISAAANDRDHFRPDTLPRFALGSNSSDRTPRSLLSKAKIRSRRGFRAWPERPRTCKNE